MKILIKLLKYLPLIFLFFLMPPLVPDAAVMSDYCLVPPYVAKQGVMPNIMIAYEKGDDIEKRAYSTTYSSTTTYYGFFASNQTYAYNSTGSFSSVNGYFEEDTCTPLGTNNCFSGNILNWALMSALDLSRKALIGFGWPKIGGQPDAGDIFTYLGNLVSFGQWKDTVNFGCTGGSQVALSGGGYKFELTKYTGGAPTKVTIRAGTTCAASAIITDATVGLKLPNPSSLTDESVIGKRLGIIQKLADKNRDYIYDSDVPRFGIKRWQASTASVDRTRDILCDAAGGNCTSVVKTSLISGLFSAISREPGSDGSTPLGTMMNDITKYFKGISSTYEDKDDVYTQSPYSWATDPLKACRKTFALFVTTGTYLSGDIYSPLPTACSSLTYTDGTTVTDAFPINTCYAYNTDLYPTDGSPPKQNISTYVVHTTFYGGADDATTVAKLTYAANISDGVYLKVDDPSKFEQVLEQAILDILNRAASGTAASVVASGEGSGANLLQAGFYPRTPKIPLGMFSNRLAWIGRLANFWYYVDPFFTTSTILEDTTSDNILSLSNDLTVKFSYDTTNEYAVGDCYDYSTGASANCGQGTTPVRLEYLKTLWDAGIQLWNRNISLNPRTIYTTVNGTSFLSGGFSTANKTTLRTYLQATNDNESEAFIRYIHGEDNPVVFGTTYSYRSRTSAFDLNGDGDTADTVNGISESAKVWKLGDILNSTPRISSWVQLNTYDDVYLDTTYGNASTNPKSGYIYGSDYTGRGMVFAGANDGMLHAFKLGMLEQEWDGQTTTQKARLTGSDLGKEIWAFIPKNALPYLKYMTDTGYCHIYTVDLSPYIFDASINGNPDDTKTVSSWRTILIGGMRFGGACKDTTYTGTDGVKIPTSGIGYSSYFALDVTDQNNPTLLWEFTHPDLGFATTGPAVVKINATGDTNGLNKNGKWFVVFGSGPTGPISTADMQFMGRSDQNLRLFVFDLKTGPGTNNANVTTKDTGLQYAFAGSMLNTTHDSDLDYQDDAIYIPYVKKAGDGTWTQGGVSRLLTKEDTDPSNWEWSKVIDDIGPVTSAVVRLQHKSKGILYLFFGTGRYYFEQSSTVDDGTNQRHLFGITEPCYDSNGSGSTSEIKGAFKSSCTSENRSMGQLSQVNLTSASGVSDDEGWYIALDTVSTGYRTERVITDPLSTTSGQVFFTTYKPYDDVCAYGGKSYLWAVKYDTGGSLGSLLRGKALLQTSTGSIEQIDLATAFTEKGGRRTSAIEGVPPTSQGLSLLTTPPPVKRIIHMRER